LHLLLNNNKHKHSS